MKPSQAKKFLTKMILNKKPCMIQSGPGLGKTDIVFQSTFDAARELGISENEILDCILPVYCATSDPIDPKGMPATWFDNNLGKQVADFLPFGYMNKIINATKLLVVFLDDLGQAPPAVQAAFMNLILARRTGDGTPISEHVVFIAATNRRQDKAGVSGILEPVKSRFYSIIEMECSVPDWIDWAIAENLDIRGITFVKFRGEQVLNNFRPNLDMENSPSPRTVTQALKMLPFLDDDEMIEALGGACGKAWAEEFTGYLRILKKIPNPDLIKTNQAMVDVPSEAHIAFALTLNLGRTVDVTSSGQIIQFMMRMHPDYWTVFKKVALPTCPEIANTVEYIQACSKLEKNN